MGTTAEAQRAEFTLNGNKMLAPLDRAAIARIEAQCTWKVAHANEPILSRDTDSRDVFFVVKGRCRIVNFSPSGREVAYAVASVGDFFGEMAAIDGLPRSATVVALEDRILGSITRGSRSRRAVSEGRLRDYGGAGAHRANQRRPDHGLATCRPINVYSGC
jgi:CRP-like cAMP-binding protein